MNGNQYSPRIPEGEPYPQGKGCLAQTSKDTYYLKKIYHVLKEMKQLQKIELYIKWMDIVQEQQSVHGCSHQDLLDMSRQLDALEGKNKKSKRWLF